jgi:hypothetical protein
MPSTHFNAQSPRFQIQIIVNDNEFVGCEFQVLEEAFKGRAADIHRVQQTCQFDYLRTEPPGTSLSCVKGMETD